MKRSLIVAALLAGVVVGALVNYLFVGIAFISDHPVEAGLLGATVALVAPALAPSLRWLVVWAVALLAAGFVASIMVPVVGVALILVAVAVLISAVAAAWDAPRGPASIVRR